MYPRADNSEILENIIALPISFNQRYTTTVCHFGGPESSGYAIATGDMTQDTETAHPILQSVNNISYDSLLACLIILGY